MSIDFSKMSADEIRQLLKSEFDVDAADIKGKSNLVAKYFELQATHPSEGAFEQLYTEEAVDDAETAGEDIPFPHMPEWHDYVMSQFDSRELVDGCPNVMGLRRVAKKLLGPITADTVKTVAVPSEHVRMAVVEATIVFEDGSTYSDVADVSPANSAEPYLSHPTSTAASKAASRALRKALGLNNILSAEEKTPEGVQSASASVFGEEPISYIQAKILEQLCQRYNINMVNYINSGDKHYNSMNQITNAAAEAMIERLNNKREEIAGNTELAGFDENWSTYFSKE